MLTPTFDNALKWQRRMGYLDYADFGKMKNGLVDGINFVDDSVALKYCAICINAKHAGSRLQASKLQSCGRLRAS